MVTESWETYILSNLMALLRKGAGTPFFGAIGSMFDMVMQRFDFVTAQSNPYEADDTFLTAMANDRGLFQFTLETKDEFANRVYNFWEDSKLFGMDTGLIQYLQLVFKSPSIRIVYNGQKDTLPDNRTDWATRFWIYVDQPNNWRTYIRGQGYYNDGTTYGTDIDPNIILDAIKTIELVKASNTFCQGLVIVAADGHEVEYEVGL